jgi:hypothetical protein
MIILSIVAVVCLLIGFVAGVGFILWASDFPKEPDAQRKSFYDQVYSYVKR